MLKVTLLSLLLLFSLVELSLQDGYRKIIHNTDPGAVCLDGSPAMIYVHEGGLKDHIMLFFLGGGICGEVTMEKTLQSCYKRSKDFLGTSTLWPTVLPSNLTEGYLSTDPNKNAFANWTKFFIPYCDGSLHQGYTRDPIKYKDAQLYFRGSAITRSHIKWIESSYGLRSASKIFLTGMSAGGIAVNVWSNYIKDYVGDDKKVYTVSDSGIFNNQPSIDGQNVIQPSMVNIYTIANVDEPTPLTQCTKHYQNQPWKCVFVQYAYPYIRGRFMVINSEYDAYAIPYNLRIRCLTQGTSGFTLQTCNTKELSYIEVYRSSYKATLRNFMAVNPDLSVWSIACSQHVYAFYDDFYDSPKQKIPTTNGKTVREAVQAFVLYDQKSINIDEVAWPGNTGCAK